MTPAEIKTVSSLHSLHVINIESISQNTEKLLDDFLVSICEGASGSELQLVKKRLKIFQKDFL